MHAIQLVGARTHHLKGVSVELNPGELVVVTGVSGAGKSSLAFDTLYSEGQRRFVESFSPYARQFLERLERPPMTSLEPVAAGVAVDRRAPIKSSRSTLATMADLEAYMSALFLREAMPWCTDCGVLAERRDPDNAARAAISAHGGTRAVLSYPVVVEGTEAFLDVRETLLKDGFRRVLIDGDARDLDGVAPSEALAGGAWVDVVVDRVKLGVRARRRLAGALEQAWSRGNGRATLHLVEGKKAVRPVPTVRGLSCPSCGRSFSEPRPGLFSYQSPVGACPECRGFGRVPGIDWRKVVPDESLSLKERAIRPWKSRKTAWERRMLRKFCEAKGIPMEVPFGELSHDQQVMVFEGEGSWRRSHYPGIVSWFRWLERKSYKMHIRVLLSRYRSYDPCDVCDGKRLSELSLAYRVDDLDLGDWHRLELREARTRLEALDLSPGHGAIARAELVTRLGYLERVGLGYLTLDRQARTLSGGEAQRVSLTAALGTSLTGALFVLDEPSIGLHPTDLAPLIEAMRQLADRGNVVMVVEHDRSVLAAADRVLEIGPGAGRDGGELVFDGTPAAALDRPELATARALLGVARAVSQHAEPRGELVVHEAAANNLQDVTVRFPLGVVTVVCGPSGSGKTSLVDHVLHRALARSLGDVSGEPPSPFGRLEGVEALRSVILVDQSPLGRTSRGNPATYTGAWTRLRARFAAQPQAILHELTPAHFSFNVAAGRCETCAGEGAETVEMQFLADVRLVCPVCKGKRFREEVLGVTLDGRSVADVLEMSVAEVLDTFDLERAVTRALRPVARLGLGYLALGQPLSTLSGGEAQRLKLARALGSVDEGTMVILDEPSAGLHADEVALLNQTLRDLTETGASVVVVDHDLGVIAESHWVIELGPDAGVAGGQVVAACHPDELRQLDTRTGRALSDPARIAPAAAPDMERRERQPGQRAIEVTGAREHNLADVDVTIPHGELVVVTGPSGSGKSSLAFDVVFAEGQRRFLETLTPYARQFLPTLPRPDTDRVTGVPPSVALEQRTTRAGQGSTVATITEIAHYLRLLFAKVGEPHCPDCQQPVTATPPDEVFATLRRRRGKVSLRAPVVRGRKGSYLDVFTAADRAGVEWALCDGKVVSTDAPPRLNKRKEHSIDLIVYEGPARTIDRDAFDRGLMLGKGQLVIGPYGGDNHRAEDDELISTTRSCRSCGLALPELDPRWYSFNTVQGRCPKCDGTGYRGGSTALKKALRAAADEAPELPPCRECDGARLAPIPRAVRLCGEQYHEMSARSISSMVTRADTLRFEGDQARIAEAPLHELGRRLRFVAQVGLGYLSLDRRARTLSGGEMQRLRMAAQLGSGLTGALYVLDEPTIGLHPRDTGLLLANLRALVDTGSTVIVVEHDADTIRAADRLIDLGPAGGRGGGRVMAAGPPAEVLADMTGSPTARALADERAMACCRSRQLTGGQSLVLRGASAHNLTIDELSIPTGRMVVVAGVSGSGKSTLVGQVLYPALRKALGRVARRPGAHQELQVPANVERAAAVDQSPIGRTSRSVPATFLGVWSPIRNLFASTPEARAMGYKPARFSFNSAAGGGRCEGCGGNGVISHEMAFLPDVKTLCETCAGARFEPATLEILYRGLSIGDVLRLTVEEATELFAAHTKIAAPLATLSDLGVGYVQLGQGSPTLSGGEAQRLKLAKELTASRQH
ncbi:MAG: excinuclease ABC subunit UvrA, partial [Deltaproteobacteria bacterium]|nr:excinuclease ABC subunit UvrA [Deltaproteobacteria bacterium]